MQHVAALIADECRVSLGLKKHTIILKEDHSYEGEHAETGWLGYTQICYNANTRGRVVRRTNKGVVRYEASGRERTE